MGIARVALTNPRAFVVGLAVGALLIASGFLLALVATSQVGATHDGSGTYHACVSSYTGYTRIMPPGQPPNCTAHEFLVELGAGDPAANLTYVVRTGDEQELNANVGVGTVSADCLQGETAIAGGVDFRSSGGGGTHSSAFTAAANFPVNSPPTGWQADYSHDTGPFPNVFAVGWVLCVS